MKDLKPWQSPYEEIATGKDAQPLLNSVPGVETLPKDRWVLLNKEASKVYGTQVIPWLEEQRMKYRVCLIKINHREQVVFLFKKTKDAVLFKLTWG